MVDVTQYYSNESAYLKAEDLEHGKKYGLIIGSVEAVEFDNDGVKQTKLALAFSNAAKKLSLNKTNAMIISAVLGPESDTWAGKKIFVYRTKVDFGGKQVDAVRVDMPLIEASMPRQQPGQSRPAPVQQHRPPVQHNDFPPDFNDDIPFS